MRATLLTASVLIVVSGACSPAAADIYGLKSGQLILEKMGPMAFGPDGILFIGDPKSAVIYALQTGDGKAASRPANYQQAGIANHLAAALQADPKAVTVNDMIVNPETGHLFFGVTVADRSPSVVKLDGTGTLTVLDLSNIPFSQARLPNPAEDREVQQGNRGRRNNRDNAITDLAFLEGQVLVSGLSNDNASSNVWSLLFPFSKVDHGTSLEIYHGAHGRSEDNAPIRTFVPFISNGEPSLLAGFQCTPLVKFPLSQLNSSSHEKVRGTTLAELGNRNRPLDMIAYKKYGKDYLLMANTDRGVMKVGTENLTGSQGITEPVRGGGTAGLPYETITELNGTVQLDQLDENTAVVLIKDGEELTLKTVELP